MLDEALTLDATSPETITLDKCVDSRFVEASASAVALHAVVVGAARNENEVEGWWPHLLHLLA